MTLRETALKMGSMNPMLKCFNPTLKLFNPTGVKTS